MTPILKWLAATAALLTLSGCISRASGDHYYEQKSFEHYDLSSLMEGKPAVLHTDPNALAAATNPGGAAHTATTSGGEAIYHRATINIPLKKVYASALPTGTEVQSLYRGEEVEVAYFTDSIWTVKKNGMFLGYCEAGGVYSGIWDNYRAYLEPENGFAPDANGDMVAATSHLVDVREYTDLFEIKMKLSTNATSIGEPFYQRNLCMLQYDTLMKLIDAAEEFQKDGYTIVIYDAYRPTSVQQRWFDVIRVHKWVADPKVGMGGIHDRGTAIDMTLMDTATGVEIDTPTAVHTLTEASARNASMTDEQKKMINYMTNVMTSCGFDYIRSEWWHFQDTNTVNYLPTDHPIDEIPLIYTEGGDAQ